MKRFISFLIVISIIFCGAICSFATEEMSDDKAFPSSLARLQAAIEYLDAEYLTSDLGNEFEYGTSQDKAELQALADYITEGCTTDKEKADSIYDWMQDNIAYSSDSFTAIDTFRYKTGVCSSHAHLFTTLCRLSDIECAIVRGMKADTTYVDMKFLSERGYRYSHEWSMTYIDNQWVLYDDLWNFKGEDDPEVMAQWYYLEHVDGVSPSPDIYDKRVEASVVQTCYSEGAFYCYKKGVFNSLYGGSVLQVGGNLRWSSSFANKTFNAYYKYLDGTPNDITGQTVFGGYYKFDNRYLVRFKENGFIYQFIDIYYNDILYLSQFGTGVQINEEIAANGLTEGKLNMYIGQTISISEYYPDSTYEVISDNISVDNGIITAISEGTAEIRIDSSKYGLYIYVYGDINESNELFQSFCEHTYTHEVEDEIYCNYCGEHIEENEDQEIIPEVVEPVAEVIEMPVEINEQLPEINETVETPEAIEEVIETPIETPEAIEEPVEIPEVIEEITEPAIETQEIIEEVTEPIIEIIPEDIELEEIIEPQVVKESYKPILQVAKIEVEETPVIEVPEEISENINIITPESVEFTTPEAVEIIPQEIIPEPIVESVIIESKEIIEEPTVSEVEPEQIPEIIDEIIETTNTVEPIEENLGIINLLITFLSSIINKILSLF